MPLMQNLSDSRQLWCVFLLPGAREIPVSCLSVAGIADPVPPDAQLLLIRLEKEQYGPSTQITGLAPFTTELSHMGIQGPIKESFSSEVSKETSIPGPQV